MIYVIEFIFLTAASNIMLNIIGNIIPNILLIFLSTTTAVIFFHLINYSSTLYIYKKILRNKLEYVMLILTLCGIWVGAFLIPIYFLPSIYLLTFMTISSTIGSAMLFYTNRSSINLFRSTFLFANLIIFYLACMKHYHGLKYIVLILATIFTGASGYGYMQVSVIFNRLGFTSSQILAIRFWLLWLVSLCGVIYFKQFKIISLSIILQAIIISFTYLIIPIYCSQKAIEKIGAEKTSLGIGFTPFVVFVFEKIFLKESSSFTGYFSISLLTILTGCYLYEYYNHKST